MGPTRRPRRATTSGSTDVGDGTVRTARRPGAVDPARPGAPASRSATTSHRDRRQGVVGVDRHLAAAAQVEHRLGATPVVGAGGVATPGQPVGVARQEQAGHRVVELRRRRQRALRRTDRRRATVATAASVFDVAAGGPDAQPPDTLGQVDVARSGGLQHGDDVGGQLGPVERAALDRDGGEPRVEADVGHLASAGGQPTVDVERAQLGEQRAGARSTASAGGASSQRSSAGFLHPPGAQLEHHRRQVAVDAAPACRQRGGGARRPRPTAGRRRRAPARPGAAATLVRARPADRPGPQRGQARVGVDPHGAPAPPASTTTRTPGTVIEVSARLVDRITRRRPSSCGRTTSCCSSGESDPCSSASSTSPGRGARPSRRSDRAPAPAHPVDLRSSGQEHEHVAAVLPQRLPHDLGHPVLERVVRRARPVPGVDGMDRRGRLHDGRRRRRGAPISAASGAGSIVADMTSSRRSGRNEARTSQQQRQRQVDVRGPLVELVQQHRRDPLEGRVGLQAAQEQPLGHHLDAGPTGRCGARPAPSSPPSAPPARRPARTCVSPRSGPPGAGVRPPRCDRPSAHGCAASTGGTPVVLPVPGGATRTAAPAPSSASSSSLRPRPAPGGWSSGRGSGIAVSLDRCPLHRNARRRRWIRRPTLSTWMP